jgi:hypothetical protein
MTTQRQPEPECFTFIVHRDVPEMGLTAADVVVWEPAEPKPLTAHRRIAPDVERLAAALTLGAVEPLLPEARARIIALMHQHGAQHTDAVPIRTLRVRGHLALVEEVSPCQTRGTRRKQTKA